MVEMVEIDRRPGAPGAAVNGQAVEAAGERRRSLSAARRLRDDQPRACLPRSRHREATAPPLRPCPHHLSGGLATAAEDDARGWCARGAAGHDGALLGLGDGPGRRSPAVLRARLDGRPGDLPSLPAQRAAAPACQLVLLLPDRGPARAARPHQHRPGRASARLAVRRGAVRAIRRPPVAARAPACAGRRLAAGEARHHQGLPHAL